ncbi:MAG: hypothetical protein M3126_11600 [Candidatus Eremiobacteraeota bacterium]|nr:hypothetical protein [Candidatus Eremiobacteraeota bacterium]
MMVRRVLCASVLALFASGTVAFAVPQTHAMAAKMKMPPKAMAASKVKAKLSDKPVGAAETLFVRSMQADLMQRFPTAADAEKAGYVRYTNEDNTGAISYANFDWQSADAQHPSQLWYDVKGNLLGADFSVLHANNPPHIWGINPARWSNFKHAHYHFIVKDPKTGALTYGSTNAKKIIAAGGTTANLDPAIVVKLGKATSATDVVKFFEFPALWDLTVWVKSNPNGAFAEKNPSVIPSANAAKDSM